MNGAKGAECIYNFVEETQQQQPKKPLYRSKYEPNLVASTFGLHGTTAVDGKGFHALKQNHVLISSFGRESEVSVKVREKLLFAWTRHMYLTSSLITSVVLLRHQIQRSSFSKDHVKRIYIFLRLRNTVITAISHQCHHATISR